MQREHHCTPCYHKRIKHHSMFLKLLFVHVFVDQEHIDYRDVKHKEGPKHEVLEVPRHPEVALYLRGALTAHFVTQMSHLEHEVVEEGEGEGS